MPSSPVVPHDDPTLLFTNAGMNQFKPIFLGAGKRAVHPGRQHAEVHPRRRQAQRPGRRRPHPAGTTRSSRCSATGRSATTSSAARSRWSWELLTQGLEARPDAPARDLSSKATRRTACRATTEAADIWKEVAGLPDDHIHYFGKDNFWEMGDTGPCGPCTEIYIDRTPDKIRRRGTSERRRPAGDGDLEQRLHPVQPQPRPLAHAAAGPARGHRHGLRAHHARSCRTRTTTTAIDLFDPFLAQAHGAERHQIHRPVPQDQRRRPRRRSGRSRSSGTTSRSA